MTYSGGKPHNVGDKGQRYEVRMTGYPSPGPNVLGWAPTLEGATQMAKAIRTAPSCTAAEVYDRQDGKVVDGSQV